MNVEPVPYTVAICALLIGSISCEGHGDGTGFVPGNCSDIQLKFTLLSRPPYVNIQMLELINEELVNRLYDPEYFPPDDQCVVVSSPPEVTTLSNESSVFKHALTNSSDFLFPVTAKKGVTTVSNKPFLALLDHPGAVLLTMPQKHNQVQICLGTIMSSWPLLALSIICTGISGIIIWICETYGNCEEFPRNFTKGSWEGFWWAFVSMTTVGYGDKCPRTIAGRCFSVVWIFVGLVIVAVFMANITTALTSISVHRNYNLADMELAVFENSTEDTVAGERGATTKGFDSFPNMLSALQSKAVDGILVDRYTASFYVKRYLEGGGLQNLTAAKVPHITGFEIGLLIGSERVQQRAKACDVTRDGEFVPNEWYELKKKVLEYAQKDIASLKQIIPSDPATFNLFIDSKQTMNHLLYVSVGVLAGMCVIGFIFDLVMKRKAVEKQSIEKPSSYSNPVTKSSQERLIVELEEGRMILRNLQSHFDKLEIIFKSTEAAEF
ncbi:uncharacterized protein LOC116614398 [Nematostella vectensis]|uniref:uncharacterized protein LOC116614398 n=1 Tax=Nematostella vectensis TaxID=45351 RepID=UPI002077997D|nr:uncharacterized protein LOC116614398 [Nematostella vectensis]